MAGGDKVPVVRLDGGLCDFGVREYPVDGKLRGVEEGGSGRVAGEEVRLEVPPLVLCPT